MYQKYCEIKKYQFQIYSITLEGDSLRECVVRIQGEDVNSNLRFESGIHRVQRVPQTETQGRVHTSTVNFQIKKRPA
jgi:peptide chain release factor 1